MPCLHRFSKELLPKKAVEFLFIGTFNPVWDISKGDNPDFFYSRAANEFWCILPHSFNQNCLVDKSRKEKKAFCTTHKIGLTDIIYSIDNVDEQDASSIFLKQGFKDEDFEKVSDGNYVLDISFFTEEIKKYITVNNKTLKGVFLTRKTSSGIPRIWKQWLMIKAHCSSFDIYTKELLSPSTRGGAIRDKIFTWRSEIEKLKNDKR